MTNNDKLYYATCRKKARLSQEEASFKLNLADASVLSRIENGHVVPDAGIVAKMIELYRVPSLATWHVSHAFPDLAQWLPEVKILQTDGDVYLQADQALKIAGKQYAELETVWDEDMSIRGSGKSSEIRNDYKRVADKAMSIVSYIDDDVA